MRTRFWKSRIPRRPSVWWYVIGRKMFESQFDSIKNMWGVGRYNEDRDWKINE